MITIVKLQKIERATGECWEGTTDKNEYVYIRYQSGFLWAGLAANDAEYWHFDNLGNQSNICFSKIGSDNSNNLDYEELVRNLDCIVKFELR